MSKEATPFILRLYFAVVSAVTLFALMFGAVDLVSIGLKTYVIPAADVPSYMEDCSSRLGGRYPKAVPLVEGETPLTEEELLENCQARNADSIANYKRNKARSAVQDLAMLLVSLPLFFLHFRILFRDWKDVKKKS